MINLNEQIDITSYVNIKKSKTNNIYYFKPLFLEDDKIMSKLFLDCWSSNESYRYSLVIRIQYRVTDNENYNNRYSKFVTDWKTLGEQIPFIEDNSNKVNIRM